MKRIRNTQGQFHKKNEYVPLGRAIFVALVLGLSLASHIVNEAEPYFRLAENTVYAEEVTGEVSTIAGQTTPSPVPSPTPEPTPEPLTEKQQILAYIVEKFGDDAADAIVVIRKCENSSFNPRAVNHNRNGSVDRGIFQLNSQYWGGEELFDWKTNVDVAYKVFTRAGKKWTPWTCAHVVGQKNYLNQ